MHWTKFSRSQSGQDDATIQMAGDDIDLPEDLAKMVEEDEEEEEINDSLLGNLQNMDMDAIRIKAQTTMTEVKQAAEEKCVVMWLFTGFLFHKRTSATRQNPSHQNIKLIVLNTDVPCVVESLLQDLPNAT